jgi:hypothetical protein
MYCQISSSVFRYTQAEGAAPAETIDPAIRRAIRLEVPGECPCPPEQLIDRFRQAGCNRTIRRYADGTALVAVRVKGRLWDDVVDDLIAGVLTVNDLHGALAAEVRYGLWCDLTQGLGHSTSAA